MAKNAVVWTLALVVSAVSSAALASESPAARRLINIPAKPPTTTRVQINNEVANGVTLTVHCASKDDDLGVHEVALHGSYAFEFHPLFFGKTLFHCQIGWPNNLHHFDVYDEDRDFKRCYFDCCYNIYAWGPCDCHSGQCFNWN